MHRPDVHLRYTYRLRPGRTASRHLAREWGMCRWIWNRMVEESEDRQMWAEVALANGAVREDLPTFGYCEQSALLTRLRATTVDEHGRRWLSEGSSVAQQQTVRAFAAVRTKALLDRKNGVQASRRRGHPRFKAKRSSLATLEYTRRSFSIKPHPTTGKPALALPGGVIVPVVWSRNLPSAPSSVRVFEDSLGHWYASFVVEAPAEFSESPAPQAQVIGIDWGVIETATTTNDAYDFPHAQHGKKAAQRLTRYQRMMNRRRTPKGRVNTKGYETARRLAAKAHKRVLRQRQDDARKWARRVARDHAQLAVEDFRPKFLAKSAMARKAADAAISGAKAELLWQATKFGRDLRLVNPAHTTTDCSNCGARTKHRLPLGERTYECQACGLVRPRDKNSAAVMVQRAFGTPRAIEARAGFLPADAEGVSPIPATARVSAA